MKTSKHQGKAKDFWMVLCPVVATLGALFLGLGQPTWSLQLVAWGVPLLLVTALMALWVYDRRGDKVSGVLGFALAWLLLLGLTASFGWMWDTNPWLTFFGVFALLCVVTVAGFIIALVRLLLR